MKKSTRDFLFQVYMDNKPFILAYMTFAIFFSFFMFGVDFDVHADTTVGLQSLGGATTLTINSILVQICGTMNPCYGLGISGVLALLKDHGVWSGVLGRMDFGLLGTSTAFRGLVFAWCVITLIPEDACPTWLSTIISGLNDASLGIVISLLNLLPTVFGLAGGLTVEAASSVASSGNLANSIVTGIMAFLLLICYFTCYFFIRVFFTFLDILAVPVTSFIPLASLGIETMKFFGMSFMIFLAIKFPYVFLLFYIAILVVSILLFRTAYNAVRYFKNIYFMPWGRKFVSSTKQFPPICNEATGLSKKMIPYIMGRNLEMLIPVYAVRKLPAFPQVKRFSLWYLMVDRNHRMSICRPSKNGLDEIIIKGDLNNKIFLNKAIRFIEIFTVPGEVNIGKKFSHVEKDLDLVMSIDYTPYLNYIMQVGNFTDYPSYAAWLRNQQNSQMSPNMNRMNP